MHATYSPEDNKLRLYADHRLDSEEFAAVKAAGFKWAPKQELFVCPRWTPRSEDLLLELCDEIGDEDYSAEERAADRAERFSGYRDKRRCEAHGHADAYDAGPSAFGHQNRQRAERQATRHERGRGRALCQWSKAEYWQQRTEGVISHALHRYSPEVRRSRILRLEADQRKHEKSRQEYAARYAAWQHVLTLDGGDKTVSRNETSDSIGIDREASGPAAVAAYVLANSGQCWGDYTHPRTGVNASMYRLLTDAADPLTAHEAATLWLSKSSDPNDPDSWSDRWSRHYELRLTYERAMQAAEGGTAAEADIEPGGWFGSHQVQKVHRSNVTGRVVSVDVYGPSDRQYKRDGTPNVDENGNRPLVLHKINIERFAADAYRPPTPEEKAAFLAAQSARKAAAPKKTEPALINPTDADAERLQEQWNREAKERHDAADLRNYGKVYEWKERAEVCRITQAVYSANSKGSYAHCETRTLHVGGKLSRRRTNMYSSEGAKYDKSLGPALCKIRVFDKGGFYAAPRVVILTDKPQKPLPLDPAPVEADVTECRELAAV